jgi:PTS system galactitol-specific IIA component
MEQEIDGPAVHPQLALARMEAPDAESALRALAGLALEAGFVRPSFPAALLERERHYPTGLPTEVPVAIPHADAEHVLRPGLGVATLATPVRVGLMGTPGQSIDARVIVLLLVDRPHTQVALLSRLVEAFQRPGWADGLLQAADAGTLAAELGRVLE